MGITQFIKILLLLTLGLSLFEIQQGCMGGFATQNTESTDPSGNNENTSSTFSASSENPSNSPLPGGISPTGIGQGAAAPGSQTTDEGIPRPVNPAAQEIAAPGTQTTDESHPGSDGSFLMLQVIPAGMANQTNPDPSLLTLDTFHHPYPLVTIQRGYTAAGPWQDIQKINTDGAGRIPFSGNQVLSLCRVEIVASNNPNSGSGNRSPANPPSSSTATGGLPTLQVELQRFLQFSAFYNEGGIYLGSRSQVVNCPSANSAPSLNQKPIGVNLTLRPLITSGVEREGVKR